MSINKPEEKEAMENKDVNLSGEGPCVGMETLDDTQLDGVSGGIDLPKLGLPGKNLPGMNNNTGRSGSIGDYIENYGTRSKDTTHRVF